MRLTQYLSDGLSNHHLELVVGQHCHVLLHFHPGRAGVLHMGNVSAEYTNLYAIGILTRKVLSERWSPSDKCS